MSTILRRGQLMAASMTGTRSKAHQNRQQGYDTRDTMWCFRQYSGPLIHGFATGKIIRSDRITSVTISLSQSYEATKASHHQPIAEPVGQAMHPSDIYECVSFFPSKLTLSRIKDTMRDLAIDSLRPPPANPQVSRVALTTFLDLGTPDVVNDIAKLDRGDNLQSASATGLDS